MGWGTCVKMQELCYFYLFSLKISPLNRRERARTSSCIQMGGGAEGANLQADPLLSMELDMGLNPTTHEIMA